jgi:flavin-dependent dehydrogenase
MLLLEAGRYDGPSAGEMLSPAARGILEHLLAWNVVESSGRPVPALASSWEHPALAEEHSLFSARGHGWMLDRARFDAELAQTAASRGADLRTGMRIVRLTPVDGGWRLTPSVGPPLQAKFLILATGRRWRFARAVGASLQTADRLIGLMKIAQEPQDGDPRLLVEASQNGWWYTAPLPHRGRVAAFMTDADLHAAGPIAAEEIWLTALEHTRFVRYQVANLPGSPPARIWPANAARLVPAAGPGWVAAGDAAVCVDPLCGQGLTRALRSGVFAAYAALDWLAGRRIGIERYAALLAREAAAYIRDQRAFYGRCRRWPTSPFWARRSNWSSLKVR